MGYKIQYGQSIQKIPITERNNFNAKPILKWVITCCVLFVMAYFAMSGYMDFLIPGDKEVTTAAFRSMVEDVRSGEGVKDAFTDFCLEILNSAKAVD